MKYSIFFAFAIIFSFYPAPQYGQRLRIITCKSNQECVALWKCNEALKLRDTDRQALRKQICSRDPVKICCPPFTKTSVKPTSKPKSLLPKLCGRENVPNLIANGETVPVGAYPWVSALGYKVIGKNGFPVQCGGSVINSRYILTAAHCLHPKDLRSRTLSVIYLGLWNLDGAADCMRTANGRQHCYKHITASPEQILIHPQYGKGSQNANDIALIRLNISISFLDPDVVVKPVCLPSPTLSIRNFIGVERPIIAGWGLNEKGAKTKIMMSGKIPLVNNEKCRSFYGKRYLESLQICGGIENNVDSCRGDSGGPLVLDEARHRFFTQIGIVSFGASPCGQFPGAYTSVVKYRNWIEAQLRP